MTTFQKKHKAYGKCGRGQKRSPTPEQNEVLVETMVIAACIDGILAPGEADTLAKLIRSTPGFETLDNKGLARTVQSIADGIARDGLEVRMDKIASVLGDCEDLKDEAFLLATLFAHYDGEVGEEEQSFLDLLQQKLGISDERASHIDAVLTEMTEQAG